MNKKPVSYLQTDPRWKSKPYRVKGESATIGGSGCGPSCAAMLIETLTGQTFTPEDACKWSVDHGYKALNAGTYYGYFAPQFAAFGIKCWQLSWTNTYHNPRSKIHDQALAYLKEGYYLIALMKKGNWTGGGHFIVVWWADGKIRINDPASTKAGRTRGSYALFRQQVKYYWVIDAPKDATKKEDGLDMTIDEMIEKMTPEQAYKLSQKAELHARTLPEPEWSQKEGHWQRAAEAGLMDGTAPERAVRRDELAAVLGRKGLV